jgi:hypothetical protein
MDGSGLQGIKISGLEQRTGRQDPFVANATGPQATDGANADP